VEKEMVKVLADKKCMACNKIGVKGKIVWEGITNKDKIIAELPWFFCYDCIEQKGIKNLLVFDEVKHEC